MKCVKCCILLTLACLFVTNAAEVKVKAELQAIAEQIEILKTLQRNDVNKLKSEIAEIKKSRPLPMNTHERNEQLTLEWAKTSMNELHVEMKELTGSFNNSVLLNQLHVIRNQLKQALTETKDLAHMTRTQEARIDKLDSETSRLKYEGQQMRNTIAEIRVHVAKLSKEVKNKLLGDIDRYNDVEPHEMRVGKLHSEHHHKLRHNKMIHTQISRLACTQNQLEEYQQNLQAQMLDVQRRLDHFEDNNWNLISAKVDIIELENKVVRDELKNISRKVSDFDRVHSSIMELREDMESIENKADKTVPEFRKEISKLDINFAQLTAKSSYLKEDQENLRQSVKAIAVSVSNTIDHAEIDRLALKKINESITELQMTSKQCFYKLNDHIMKSEANNSLKQTKHGVALRELTSEVKDLQPVQREYEDLLNQLPMDCSSISGPPGTYLIHPGTTPLDTWCVDGSTLIQRRCNGTVEFNRNFDEYTRGFGDPSSEYWLGLDPIHHLTADNCSSMRIDMTDIYGVVWYAQYEHFYVGGPESGYVLEVGGFEGNASDAFEYQNHMQFSTIDRDRDISNTHCAANYEGGWWFSHCQHVNINGKYNLGLTWFNAIRNEWIAVATSEMRMMHRPGCT